MVELIVCQCVRAARPCAGLATQEDFLCDGCRAGCSVLSFGELTVGASTGATAPVAKEMKVLDHHARVEFDGLTFGTLHMTGGPEIDSALPATREHANRPENPPSDRTSPHVRTPGPTSNPRNENP